MKTCGQKCEIFSRVCGYHRPVKNWNKGKRAEFADRKVFLVPAKHLGEAGYTPSIESIQSIKKEIIP